MSDHEKRFQEAFVSGLVDNGWTYSGSEGCGDYDKNSAVILSDLRSWIVSTQPRSWARLVRVTGSDDKALGLLVRAVTDSRKRSPSKRGGTYNLLTHGVEVRGIRFHLFKSKPASISSPAADWEAYRQICFRVVSEFRYSKSKPHDAIDLGFFINGIPVGTAELKSFLSQQGVGEAEKQYRSDRVPGKDLVLDSSAGALFHFAVDPSSASLTTALDGKATRFIPYNTGSDNTQYAQDNPDEAYAVAYLWREVLASETLGLIISGMMRNVESGGVWSTRFPRYHQLDNLKKITQAVQAEGGRKNYLSQHAPGSGKSDEIANLAYSLSLLHDQVGKPIYSSVIVITNRTVLDDQLRNLLQNKATVDGYFHPITKSRNGVSKSTELSTRLLSVSPPRIMSVTAQTFTQTLLAALDAQAETSEPGKRIPGNYAIIVDEAHDGETGKQHQNMYRALLGETISYNEVLTDDEASDTGAGDASETLPEDISTTAEVRTHLPTLNFFAYTATPNADALRVFGERTVDDNGDPSYVPFHTYSMRQAREEGYINDVLENYVTHERYIGIEIDNVKYEGNKIVDFAVGRQEIGSWLQTHPDTKNVIVDIIIQKMRNLVLPALGGRGKAMLTCSSRSEAIAYKHLIEAAIAELPDKEQFETLVAFSGTFYDPVIKDEVSELDARLNKSLGRQRDLAVAFDSDQYRLMIVANKYQVGFDQPKLMCMFLDKPLTGINLVQTTARVNRKIPGKDNVYIFDFVNDREQVIDSFKAFDEDATLPLSFDLSTATLDDILRKLGNTELYTDEEFEKVRDSCRLFNSSQSTEKQKNQASADMSKVIGNCLDRLTKRKMVDATEAVRYRALLRKFGSIYSLLSITRDSVEATRVIYQKYGYYAQFFSLLYDALGASRNSNPDLSVDVNALTLKRYEIVAQNPLGAMGDGDFGPPNADYGSEVSTVEFTSKLGPVEALINEINDYPENAGYPVEETKQLVESIIEGSKDDHGLHNLATSNSESSFCASREVQRKILRILAIQHRKNLPTGSSTIASRLLGKQENDDRVLEGISQMLYKVITQPDVVIKA